MSRHAFAQVLRMWPVCAGIVLLAGGCTLGVLSERPTEDVTPALPAQEEANPADVNRSLSNQPPTADAGPGAAYSGGDQVLLDATGSADPDNDPLAYQWEQVGGSPRVEFASSPSASMVEFTAPSVTAATTLTFRVTVRDGFAYAAADVRIVVQP